MGHDPGLRVETEVYRILVLHLLKALCKLTFLRHATHCREVIDFLKRFELTELLRENGHIVPDHVDIGMAIGLILLRLFCLIVLCIFVVLISSVFFALFIGRLCAIEVFLLGSDNFPLELESTLSDDLVLRIGQVYPYFSTIEDVVITCAHHSLALPTRRSWLLTCLFCGGCGCLRARRHVAVACSAAHIVIFGRVVLTLLATHLLN